jgi:hypothetical protein
MNTSSQNFQHPSRVTVAQSVSFPTNEMKAKDSMSTVCRFYVGLRRKKYGLLRMRCLNPPNLLRLDVLGIKGQHRFSARQARRSAS